MTTRQSNKIDHRALSLYQLLKPEVLADPTPFYRKLREDEPVRWDAFMHSWVVSSHAEVVTVLTKFKSARTPTPEQLERMGLSILAPYAEIMLKQMMFMDAPSHTRLRALCSSAFTPRRMEIFRLVAEEIANSLIDAVEGQGRMDLIADFAGPFPSILLTAIMGLPADDYQQVRLWALDFTELLGNFEHDPDRIKRLVSSSEHLFSYIAEKVTQQRTEPREGVISSLLSSEADGTYLTDDEVIANAMLILAGGLEEITNLIGNGMLVLLQRPDQLALLRDDPAILATAIEEIIRFESPTQYTGRVAPHDVELGDKTIRKGDAVIAVLAAANRDPARFTDPDQLDLKRADNRHVAFGWASHYCLGAPLARLSGQIAIPLLLRRLPDLTLLTTQPVWRGMAAMRGVTALEVEFNARTAASIGEIKQYGL